MAETTDNPDWNLSAAQWDAVVRRAQTGSDALADGAFVRAEAGPQTDLKQIEPKQIEPKQIELVFYATTVNKPAGWGYPFLENVPQGRTRGALIGRAWQEAGTGHVRFEVMLLAAAQAIAADYESGASDLDFVTYEQAVEQAVQGTASDLAWLHAEFGHLALLSVGA